MPFPGFVSPPIIGRQPAPPTPVAAPSANPAAQPIVSRQRRAGQRVRRRHAQILRAPIPARPVVERRSIVAHSARPVMREKLAKASSVLLRAPGTLGVPRAKTIKPLVVHSVGSRVQRLIRRRHKPLILHGASGFIRSPRVPLTHSAKPLLRGLRSRHRIVNPRTRMTVGFPVQRIRLGMTRSRTRMLLGRHSPIILRAPIAPTVFVTQETIKHIYLRSVARLTRQRVRLTHNQPVILRAPGTLGVPRAKTIKAIYLHGVGRYSQLARKRRHKALILKSPLLITTPYGRITLRPVDRSRSWLLRRHKIPTISRSKGGVPAAGVTQKTLIPIFLKPALRKFSSLRRRHRPVVLRAPLFIAPRSTRITLRPVNRDGTAKVRRRDWQILRAPVRIPADRRTVKPILARPIRKRYIGWKRRHFLRFLRSLGGQSASQVVYTNPFDEPTPTGIATSSPAVGRFDEPSPAGLATSSPTEAAFDPPNPIGQVD